ncbi:hypothetical protein [Paracoccus spongiarum]|uniref:Uncharacterized protein n=1 Tax=Paracoccus spongiarum TaxID=3064387 RepID=A0ABT9JAP2_9RHOB|nr:hypothetical protein [Paracoccus sp. 2205BS29-5]MDP5306739.1 hypothetical protein [Paracoccus sp. 2205BS29-5]
MMVFRHIIGPCAMPGIMAGWIITVMLTAGSAVTPILPGGKNSGWSTGQICNRFVTRCTGDAGAIFGVLPRAFASRVTWPGLRVTAQSLATTVAEGEAMARAPSYATLRLICRTCGAAVLLYRVAAVLAAGIVAFNDTMFPPPPRRGFTPWFFNGNQRKEGRFHGDRLLRGLWQFLYTGGDRLGAGGCGGNLQRRPVRTEGVPVQERALRAVGVGAGDPGVILVISILVCASTIADGIDAAIGVNRRWLRPEIPLIVPGPFWLLTTITSLEIAARSPGCRPAARADDGDGALAVPGAVLGLRGGVSRPAREFQHHADARRIGRGWPSPGTSAW